MDQSIAPYQYEFPGLDHCVMIMQNVHIRGTWVKGRWELLMLMILCLLCIILQPASSCDFALWKSSHCLSAHKNSVSSLRQYHFFVKDRVGFP